MANWRATSASFLITCSGVYLFDCMFSIPQWSILEGDSHYGWLSLQGLLSSLPVGQSDVGFRHVAGLWQKMCLHQYAESISIRFKLFGWRSRCGQDAKTSSRGPVMRRVARVEVLQLLCRMDDPALDQGGDHFDLTDLLGWNLEYVPIQHNQIGAHSNGDLSYRIVEESLVSSAGTVAR